MFSNRVLPKEFIKQIRELEKSYMTEVDPIRQSGFGGGEQRWRTEREPILEAVDSDGDFLDVGCANGYLLECLINWAAERGFRLVPFGLDLGEDLIGLARKRHSEHAGNFFIGNAWEWIPPRKFKYVYSLYDCVPNVYLEEYIGRLLKNIVSENGRLILGAYGSRSHNEPPFDLAEFCRVNAIPHAGQCPAGQPLITSFVWIDN